jgi:TIR domain-containing protein
MAQDVFVSHSVKDKAVADAIVARLEADSVTCWIAPRDVVPGADWGESIIDAIEASRIMILIFSRNADASPQIKREVERAVNKGVYIIPFRVDDIPPTKSLEYFISTSQWMDAFSPPLERHLDNLAKTVEAVLKRPPLPGANVPAQPEKPSIPKPPVRPSGRKSILIAITIAALVIVGGAGWYLVQKKKGPPEKPALTPIETSTPVPITPAAVTPVPALAPTPVPTLTPQSPPPSTPFSTLTTPPPPPITNMINDEEVRKFVTDYYLASQRGDVDYLLSQYDDLVDYRDYGRRDRTFIRNDTITYFKKWPQKTLTPFDIAIAHSALPDTVTAYFEIWYVLRDPVSRKNTSGQASEVWKISKKSGALKIVSQKETVHRD